jgi:hypothetical protein
MIKKVCKRDTKYERTPFDLDGRSTQKERAGQASRHDSQDIQNRGGREEGGPSWPRNDWWWV